MEGILRRPIEVVMWYQWWGVNWFLGKSARDFQPKWLVEAEGRDVLIKWEPWKPGRQVLQPRFSINTIVEGAHDAYIRQWAQRAQRYGRPFYLCPMPEPNGSWSQWSTTIGRHQPEDYIKAWRHLHKLFAQEGAANVKWVWSPNAGDMPAENRMERYYPGSDSVDVLGLSVYNWGTARSWSQWRSFEEILLPSYNRLMGLGDQPIWITEMACAPEGGDQRAWVRAMFAALPHLPRLKSLIWFNIKKETDWRITAHAALAREFQSGTDQAAGNFAA